ncbi:MAG: serine hydrolase domain-containing protein [Bacteroidota bacterium]
MDRRNFVSLCAQSALFGAAAFNYSCSKKEKAISFDSSRIEKLISAWMTEFKVPGASVAYIQHGELAWNKAFGVRSTATNEPVDTDTLFEAASVSKTVFAYAVMKLVETKVLSLDRPLSEYYPELFADGDPRMKLITTRHVLSHATGLPNWRESNPLKLKFDPGTGFGYSGEGFYLLQTVVSHLKGKIFDQPCGTYEATTKVCATDIAEYMKQNVLVPNGMTSSTYEIDYPTAKNVAIPHDQQGEPYHKNSFNAANVARYASAGGLVTNAKEYAQFLIGLFRPKVDDHYLLNAASINNMLRPQTRLPKGEEIDGCQQWALGWGIKEQPEGKLIVHSGGQQGIISLTMASIEHQDGFVIFTNSDNGGRVTYRLADELNKELFV